MGDVPRKCAMVAGHRHQGGRGHGNGFGRTARDFCRAGFSESSLSRYIQAAINAMPYGNLGRDHLIEYSCGLRELESSQSDSFPLPCSVRQCR